MNQNLQISNEFYSSIADSTIDRSTYSYMQSLFDAWKSENGIEESVKLVAPTVSDYKRLSDDEAKDVKVLSVNASKEYVRSKGYLTRIDSDAQILMRIENYISTVRDISRFRKFEETSFVQAEVSEKDLSIIRTFVQSKSKEWLDHRLIQDVVRYLDIYLKDNDLKINVGASDKIRLISNETESIYGLKRVIKRINSRLDVSSIKSDFAKIPSYQLTILAES